MKLKLIVSTIILGFAVSCNNGGQVGMSGQNLNLSYANTTGSLRGPMSFDINGQKWSDNEIQISYDESLQEIELIGSTQSATIESPQWWKPLSSVNASGAILDIKESNPKQFVMKSASVSYGEDHYALSNLNMNCKTPKAGLRPLENCLQNGSINIANFQMDQANSLSFALNAISVTGTDASFKNLELVLKNGNFNLELKATMSVTVTIKGDGHIEYLPSGGDFDLRVRIDKLKASFLNIKDDLFKELKKNESDTLKVQAPYIYIAFE